MSIPRQVGKTFLVGAIIFALCVLLPNLTVIWTAHRLRTAEETFGKMQVFAKRRLIQPHIAKVVLGSGEEEILFRNGSRILFGARERGFGLGFDEIDVLVFDEAQRLKESALDDMIPATNQSRQPTGALLLFMGTPPRPTDTGDVFRRMRTEVLTGEDADTGWIEFGSDPEYRPTPLPAQLTAADWSQVAKANPSFPNDTPREAILRMRKKLGPESFLREGLGIWDEDTPLDGLTPALWESVVDSETSASVVSAFSLAVALDRSYSSIGMAGLRDDGLTHLELVEYRRGTGWAVPRCVELDEKYAPAVWVVDGTGPSSSLITEMENAGLNVVTASTADVGRAYSQLIDGARDATYRHGPQAEVDGAVEGAKKRPIGDGSNTFGRRKSDVDISPIESLQLANWGHNEFGPVDADAYVI